MMEFGILMVMTVLSSSLVHGASVSPLRIDGLVTAVYVISRRFFLEEIIVLDAFFRRNNKKNVHAYSQNRFSPFDAQQNLNVSVVPEQAKYLNETGVEWVFVGGNVDFVPGSSPILIRKNT